MGAKTPKLRLDVFEGPGLGAGGSGKALGWIEQQPSGMWRGYRNGFGGCGPFTQEDAVAYVRGEPVKAPANSVAITQDDLLNAHRVSGIHAGGEVALEALEYRIAQTRRDALNMVEYLTRRLAEAEAGLKAEARCFASCGVLQGNAMSFDSLMVQLAALESLREVVAAGVKDAAQMAAGKKGGA